MANVYFIGGAPRVGKTLLALEVLRERPMFCISADSVRDMLRAILRPLDQPALFAIQQLAKDESAMAQFLRMNPDKGVKVQNDESSVIWPSVNEIVLSHLADGQDVLVEGVEILPHNLAQAAYPFKAVFLGNTSLEHGSTIAAQAHSQPHDWMHTYTDSTIGAWARLTRQFSSFIKNEAKTYTMPYVEIHDAHFQESLHHARSLLLGTYDEQ